MSEAADAIPGLDWIDPPLGVAPIGRFLDAYNRQLSHTPQAMEEWWVFGGFLDELSTAEERHHAETMLRRLAAANGDGFERLCSEIETLAAPAWRRRMRAQVAVSLDEVRSDQTGALLAALAAIAGMLGWKTRDDFHATGFGTQRSRWQFSPRGIAETTNIAVRVGTPRRNGTEPVDLDFAMTADESPAGAVRAAFHRLAELTALAAESDTLIDLQLIRRLETLRQL